jgi:hypothetical protein
MLPAINISTDIKRLTRGLNDTARNQVPFATAKALTASADLARITVTRQLPSIFDKPTPFTMRGITIQAATKRNLQARVFVKDKQAAYLDVQETGGEIRPKAKRPLIMATDTLPRDAYGNLPRGTLRREKRKKDVFVGKVGKRPGFFQRLTQGAEIALAFMYRRFKYKPRFQFRARVTKSVRATLPAAFKQALTQAMRTARR